MAQLQAWAADAAAGNAGFPPADASLLPVDVLAGERERYVGGARTALDSLLYSFDFISAAIMC